MAPKGGRRPAHFTGDAKMRKLILTAVLTIAAVILSVMPVFADSAGPGI